MYFSVHYLHMCIVREELFLVSNTTPGAANTLELAGECTRKRGFCATFCVDATRAGDEECKVESYIL